MTERFIVDDCGTLMDRDTRTTYDYVEEVAPILNAQYERLREKDELLTDLLKVNENQQKLLMRFEEISEKYNIKLEDIPVTFEEYVALDNGDEL